MWRVACRECRSFWPYSPFFCCPFYQGSLLRVKKCVNCRWCESLPRWRKELTEEKNHSYIFYFYVCRVIPRAVANASINWLNSKPNFFRLNLLYVSICRRRFFVIRKTIVAVWQFRHAPSKFWIRSYGDCLSGSARRDSMGRSQGRRLSWRSMSASGLCVQDF